MRFISVNERSKKSKTLIYTKTKMIGQKVGDDYNVTFSILKQNKVLGPFMSIATLYKINSLHVI